MNDREVVERARQRWQLNPCMSALLDMLAAAHQWRLAEEGYDENEASQLLRATHNALVLLRQEVGDE